jgi:hypothetical protein
MFLPVNNPITDLLVYIHQKEKITREIAAKYHNAIIYEMSNEQNFSMRYPHFQVLQLVD